jgi:hypothetical protein
VSFWRENSKGLQSRLDVAEEQLFKWKSHCEKAERDPKTREGEWESSRVNLVRQRDDELARAPAAEKDVDRYRTECDDARRHWEAREQQVKELTTSKEQRKQDLAATRSTLLKLQTDFGDIRRELHRIRAEGANQLGYGRVKAEVLPGRREVLWQSPGALEGDSKPTSKQATATWEALGDAMRASATTSQPPGSCSTHTRPPIQTTTSTRPSTRVPEPAWSA